MGLKDFLITSDSETVAIPQFARKAESDKKLRNKAVSRKMYHIRFSADKRAIAPNKPI